MAWGLGGRGACTPVWRLSPALGSVGEGLVVAAGRGLEAAAGAEGESGRGPASGPAGVTSPASEPRQMRPGEGGGVYSASGTAASPAEQDIPFR